jgi:hypothetical protein
MPAANPVYKSFITYLRFEFSNKKDWEHPILNQVFTYEKIKEAMNNFKKSDPGLYKMLWYASSSGQGRIPIAERFFIDNSTLKRRWDKGVRYVMNYLIHEDLIPEDLIEFYPDLQH